ncbi:hydroxymethylbilane synthase [Rivibacter subsaxonicus]|nr:hydroxymethylbilane synthase [Rivibacter subsaxonicus]
MTEVFPQAPGRWVIATRESRLALWQAEHVKALLGARLAAPVELLGMTTRGDQILDRTLSKVGGKGLFVKELETALESGAAHLAVHSLKDVPMEMPAGFVLAAVLEREDPRDAWVSARHAGPAELPAGAVIGTSSLRRQVQLAARWPQLRIEPLRGNLDTRLRKLDEGQYDGIVLAAAGLKRLGLGDRIRAVFEADQMIPAAGQGALGIELRADAEQRHPLLWAAVRALVDDRAWLATHAERAVARALGGSCSMPLAAHARFAADGRLELHTLLGAHDGAAGIAPVLADGRAEVRDTAAAEALGREVAARLLASGGSALIAPAR